jgi:hypothetical protein
MAGRLPELKREADRLGLDYRGHWLDSRELDRSIRSLEWRRAVRDTFRRTGGRLKSRSKRCEGASRRLTPTSMRGQVSWIVRRSSGTAVCVGSFDYWLIERRLRSRRAGVIDLGRKSDYLVVAYPVGRVRSRGKTADLTRYPFGAGARAGGEVSCFGAVG